MKISTYRENRRASTFLLALSVLLLSTLIFAVTSSAVVVVPLNPAHVGADSRTYKMDEDTGGLSDPVVWHFVLNGLDKETLPASIEVVFESFGAASATGTPVGNGKTHHFYLGTPDHDVLLGGMAFADSQLHGQLLLSHVAVNIEEPEVPPEPEVPEIEPEPEVPAVEPEPEEPVDEEDPALPFTEADASEPEPNLPYTGVNPHSWIWIAAVFGFTGLALERFGRRVLVRER